MPGGMGAEQFDRRINDEQVEVWTYPVLHKKSSAPISSNSDTDNANSNIACFYEDARKTSLGSVSCIFTLQNALGKFR